MYRLLLKADLYVSQEVIEKVKKGELGTDNNISRDKNTGNPYASWDFMNHVRDTKKKGEEVTSTDGKKCIADDNTCPNHYIKQAVIESFKHKFNIPIYGKDYFKDYEACHVWDKPKDFRYYASIPNLVLLPSALAQLTDDNEKVKKMLRYRVYELFQFNPDEVKLDKPSFYDKIKWRNIWENKDLNM